MKHNVLMSKKHTLNTLNYLEHFLVYVSGASVCISISAFVFLVDAPVNIAISTLVLKFLG